MPAAHMGHYMLTIADDKYASQQTQRINEAWIMLNEWEQRPFKFLVGLRADPKVGLCLRRSFVDRNEAYVLLL